MTRAMTFDDRKMAVRTAFVEEPREEPPHEFKMLSRRNTTFTERQEEEQKPDVNFDDLLFRRFFGEAPELKKGMSFGNMSFQYTAPIVTGNDAVIIVDTFSTGAMLADLMFHRGFKIVCVLSGDLAGLLDMIPEGLSYSFSATIVLNSSIEPDLAIKDVIAEVDRLGFHIAAVVAGAETGDS
jgi:hypothetical protein